jgi:hypothetical protein
MSSAIAAYSACAAGSRASVLVVRIPAIASLRKAVIIELVRRTRRELSTMRRVKNRLTIASGGTIASTISASIASSQSIAAADAPMRSVAHPRSRITHGAMPLTRPQSEVSRESSQPTGR